jgi:hypothetical protein
MDALALNRHIRLSTFTLKRFYPETFSLLGHSAH